MSRKYLFPILGVLFMASALIWVLMPISSINSRDESLVTEHFQAHQWQKISDGVGDSFSQIQFVDESHGWGITSNQLWSTNDGGLTWLKRRTSLPVKLFSSESKAKMARVQFINLTDGWLLEGNDLLHTKDGGKTWQKQETDQLNVIRAFHFLDKSIGWWVGAKLCLPKNDEEVESWHGVVYMTKDGGQTWDEMIIKTKTKFHSRFSWHLLDIWSASSKDIWAVGDIILHSTDGGYTWAETEINRRHDIYGKPTHIQFTDSAIGWITTNQGNKYLITNDGGETWDIRLAPTETGGFTSLYYRNLSEAWGVAGNVYYSNDSGKTWLQVEKGKYIVIGYSKEGRTLWVGGNEIATYRSQ